jgi:hypothetical protein
MFLGDVRGKAIGRHLLPAEPAEGLAGRDVDTLHSQQHEWLLFARQAQAGRWSCVAGEALVVATRRVLLILGTSWRLVLAGDLMNARPIVSALLDRRV